MRTAHVQQSKLNHYFFDLEIPSGPNERFNFDLGLQHLESDVFAEDVRVEGHLIFEVHATTLRQANKLVTTYGLRPYVCQVIQ